MLDDENIEILDDDNNTSAPNFNLNNNNTDNKKLQNQIDQNRSRQINNHVPSGNGGINNGNQFKNSGNLSKISGNKNNHVEENTQNNNLKNLGKQQIKPLVRKGVQAATGGVIGTDPVTGKIIDKAVDKVADNPNVEKIIDDVTTKVKKKKNKMLLKMLLPLLPSMLTLIVIIGSMMSPVALANDVIHNVGSFFASVGNWLIGNGFCANEEECQNKYSEQYYNKIGEVTEKYEEVCDAYFNSDLITSTIFYEQMVLVDEDISISDDDDDDGSLSESTGSFYNYKNAHKKVDDLFEKLYPNFDDSESENRCDANYNVYQSYLYSYIKSNFKTLRSDYRDEYSDDEIVADILAFGNEVGGLGSNSNFMASGTYKIGDKVVSNVMVRLMDNDGKPLEDQELITLEKYVLGVVYGEIGSAALEEQAKVQAIAARSFALSRPSVMNGAGGVKLVEENGQWILYIRNSTNDQVYCDPDLGCSQRADAVFVSGMDNVMADPDAKYHPKEPLDENAPLRDYVDSVAGIVALDANEEILVTGYNSDKQNKWRNAASEGKDYTEILRETYQDIVEFSDGNYSAGGAASGDFTKWKQTDPQWKGVIIAGSDTIGRIGCTLTSVAIQVAHSGVDTPLGSDFNPGTLVENYRDILFDSSGNFYWNAITSVVPNFVHNALYDGTGMASMSDSNQMAFLTNGINNGCYYVVEVKTWKSGQHWVAIDYIDNGIIYMMDPASNNVDLNATVANTGYNYRINTARCYQVR